jgi:hypothetical protein
LRTWIHKRWHYVYWDGCEGDESLVREAGHRWFGLEFAKQKRVGEEKAIRNEAAGIRHVKFFIRMLFSLAFAPWYALAVAFTEWIHERREQARLARLAKQITFRSAQPGPHVLHAPVSFPKSDKSLSLTSLTVGK